MNKNILKSILVILIIFCCSACYIHFDFPLYDDYYDENLRYIEEENRKKEEEKKLKIESRTYFDPKFNGYFALLNDEEKQVYYDIVENANEFNNDFFELTYRVSIDRLKDIFTSVLYDNPDLFWIKNYWYYKDSETKEVYSVMLIYYDRDLEVDSSGDVELVKEKNKIAIDENKIKKEELDNIVNSILVDASKYGSVLEKEKYIHDLLVNKITFDNAMKEDQSPYGALVYNKAVCAGYAKAFQLLMKKLDIPTFYVSGEAWDEEGKNLHAWNLILIDNEYYNVDVTWDDPIDRYYGKNRLRYDYFNVNDDIFSKDHTRTELSLNLPSALGTTYSNIYK